MKRFINFAGVTYVAFALIAAHTSLASIEATPPLYANLGRVVVVAEEAILNSPRLYQSDAEASRAGGPCDDCDDCDRTDKSCYTIQLWTASWCSACPAYKAKVQPALLKLGYTVVVKDLDKDSDERPELRAVPAVCVYYNGEPITIMIAPAVAKIDKFVEGHMADEPDEPDEVPDWDLY